MEIVIADDDPISRKVVIKIIERAGHKAFETDNGITAWEMLRLKKSRMLISDWMMPGMDGIELSRKIRETEWPCYIYIILLTGNNDKGNVAKGLDAGADDYLIKPVQYDELTARMRSGQRIIQLEENYRIMNTQLLLSDKMASIGQLAAGIAHEINNPIGFISSNLATLAGYQKDIAPLIEEYRKFIEALKNSNNNGKETKASSIGTMQQRISDTEQMIDVDFLLDDIPRLIAECRDGTKRIKQIVLDLKDFAHPGENELNYSDINNNMDSTLNVVWNEIKYKATVTKDYGELPLIKCYPQQLNQVFMNILVNAAQAIEKFGTIDIITRSENGCIKIEIRDTGCGIPAENIPKVFDPFFTTKEIGRGTGLGLNVAYNIIKKHNGSIEVKSRVGKGTSFEISIPVNGMDED